MIRPAPFRTTVLLLALAAPAGADTIHQVAGSPIEDCTIVEETLTEVSYKLGRGGSVLTVPSDGVLRVEYERKPRELGDAEDAVGEQDFAYAVDLLQSYVAEHADGEGDDRYPWAPPYAAYRLLEIQDMLGNLDGSLQAADRLLESFPTSRYVPVAYVTKANVLYQRERDAEALETLEAFQRIVDSKGLSKRWELECTLSKLQVDGSLSGTDRRAALSAIEKDAGREFPTVRNRAIVARGESFLADAGKGDRTLLDKARDLFEQVLDDPGAEDVTLAGAHAGLGDCIFQGAAKAQDAEALRVALKHFMRVVVLYPGQPRYVAKSLLYAGRCYDLLDGEGDDERASRLYATVVRDYPGSYWADEAKSFLR